MAHWRLLLYGEKCKYSKLLRFLHKQSKSIVLKWYLLWIARGWAQQGASQTACKRGPVKCSVETNWRKGCVIFTAHAEHMGLHFGGSDHTLGRHETEKHNGHFISHTRMKSAAKSSTAWTSGLRRSRYFKTSFQTPEYSECRSPQYIGTLGCEHQSRSKLEIKLHLTGQLNRPAPVFLSLQSWFTRLNKSSRYVIWVSGRKWIIIYM